MGLSLQLLRGVFMIGHMPQFYIGGVYIHETEEWGGNFLATSEEIMGFMDTSVSTVEAYDACVCMITAQNVYELWWSRVTQK